MIHPQAIYRFTDGDFVGRDAIQTAFEKTWAYDVVDERVVAQFDVDGSPRQMRSCTRTGTP